MLNKKNITIGITVVLSILVLGLIVWFRLISFPDKSSRIECQMPEVSNNIKLNFDNFKVQNVKFRNYLYGFGWAFINNEDASQQEICIVLVSDKNKYVYSTIEVGRPDLPKAFNVKDKALEKAGFKGYIPIKEIEEGKYQVGILIQDNGSSYLSNSNYIVQKQGNELKVINEQKKTQDVSKSSLSSINIDEAKVSNDLNYYIDSAYISGSYVNMAGWAYLKDVAPSSTSAFVALKNDKEIYSFVTSKVNRPDVTKFFNNKVSINLDASGWKVVISKDDIPDNTYKVLIVMKNKDQYMYHETDYILEKNDNEIEVRNQSN